MSQSKIIKSSYTIDELIQSLKTDTLLAAKGFERGEKEFTFKTGATLKSWGEIIVIAQKGVQENAYKYQVSIWSQFKTTIVVYGKSLRNIAHVERVLTKSANKSNS